MPKHLLSALRLIVWSGGLPSQPPPAVSMGRGTAWGQNTVARKLSVVQQKVIEHKMLKRVDLYNEKIFPVPSG